MNAMMTLMNILLIHIILTLVLVVLVRHKTSVYGHARSKDKLAVPG